MQRNRDAARGGKDPEARLREQGIGYVAFALQSPGAFKLIFRKDKLNCDDPELSASARGAFLKLETAMRDLKNTPTRALDPTTFAAVIGAWSLVHGFAQLAVDGEFDHFLLEAGPDALLTQLLPGVLDLLPGGGGKPSAVEADRTLKTEFGYGSAKTLVATQDGEPARG